MYESYEEMSTKKKEKSEKRYNIKAQYIKWYIDGQFSIVSDTIEALAELIHEFEE